MSIKFKCACGKKLFAPDGAEGKRARCPVCSTVMRIPVPGEAKAPQEELEPVHEEEIAAKAEPAAKPPPSPEPPKPGPTLPAKFLRGDEPATAVPKPAPPPAPPPVAPPRPQPSPATPHAPTAGPPKTGASAVGKGKRILVVDDEPDTVETVKDMLELHGYEVVCAYDGEEAVKKAQTEKPNLVVLDVMLPKMNGFQVCKVIKDPTNPKNKDCWRAPVVILTAKSKGQDIQYAKHVGADAFVRKPFKPIDLYSRLEKLLGIAVPPPATQ
ncbi:MAG: response regulator [Planctomycetes bacterium]|nr:response regulator [Planctomycetota bacterium]